MFCLILSNSNRIMVGVQQTYFSIMRVCKFLEEKILKDLWGYSLRLLQNVPFSLLRQSVNVEWVIGDLKVELTRLFRKRRK